MPTLRRAFVAAAVIWAAVLFVAPLAAHRADAFALALAYGAYSIGHVVCHQLPQRSFHLMATPLPVCARCTGLYVGAAAAVLLAPVFDRARRRRVLDAARIVLIAAAVPTAITLFYEWTTGVTPANWVRAAAGVPLGAAIAWIIREVN